ncbi:MAG: 2-dehydro-3-deoxygalactonokinase [Bacillota bacterium]|nr:2-dehydro-3-deoxygalactonokinase [Bacillota bacterium]
MKLCVIDCGTSTTRVLIGEGGMILAKAALPVGVRSTAITGSNDELKAAIAKCWRQALAAAKVSPNKIDAVVASGMITSNLGLVELPHLTAPVGLAELRGHLVERLFPDVLPLPIHFVRGVKNCVQENAPDGFALADFMRGEETQALGLLHLPAAEAPFSYVSLGSHTKIIGVDREGRIVGSVTTLCGELFAALRERTAIGDSLPRGNDASAEQVNMSMVYRGFETVQNYGLTRALFVPRLLDVLFPTTPMDRFSFVEGALIAADFQSFPLARRLGLPLERLLIAGHPLRTALFTDLLGRLPDFHPAIHLVAQKSLNQALLAAAAALVGTE